MKQFIKILRGNKNYNNDLFIWTEAFNCGELIDPFLDSYLAHNKDSIHVYCTSEDLKFVKTKSSLVKFHTLDGSKKDRLALRKIQNGYKFGHKGTAELWTFLILTRPEKYFLHLDADTIFLSEVISNLRTPLIEEGFTLVGSRRPYLNRTYRLTGLDSKLLNFRPDTVNTDCFAFDKSKVKKVSRYYLRRRIQGKKVSLLPVVDFFDPISFELIKKFKVLFIDSPKDGLSGNTNFDSKFMQNRISFSAVGSGINFFKNPGVETSPGYRKYALASYSLYSKYILDSELDIEPLFNEQLEKKLQRLNKRGWFLSE